MSLYSLLNVLYGACKIKFKGEILCYDHFVDMYKTPDITISEFLNRYEVISVNPLKGIYNYLILITDK